MAKKQQGDVVYLLYKVPGQWGGALDVLPLGAAFVRVMGEENTYDHLLWRPGRKTPEKQKMRFVYGYVFAGGNEKRWGWIALDALTEF